MNCKRVRLKLSAYQDRELTFLQSQELERHMGSCLACKAEWESLNELVNHLGQLTTPAPDSGFSSRIMAGLRTQPEKKYRLLPSLAYTLACLMIFISGFLLEMSANGQPPTTPQPTITTFSAVLTESRDLGLLTVQDSTLELFSNLKQISLVKKQDNLLSKLLIPPLQGTSLRSRVSGDTYEK
ncbi:MAG: zf-HC2 domain-containing protein [Chrysiogenales bacterium]